MGEAKIKKAEAKKEEDVFVEFTKELEVLLQKYQYRIGAKLQINEMGITAHPTIFPVTEKNNESAK